VEVRRLLGPPSSEGDVGLQSVEEMMLFHPDRYPFVNSRIWLGWTDPNDKEKWVLLLLLDGRVFQKFKHGF
jgi:hypothetical protein